MKPHDFAYLRCIFHTISRKYVYIHAKGRSFIMQFLQYGTIVIDFCKSVRIGVIVFPAYYLIIILLLIESIFRLQDALNSKKFNPNYKNALILAIIGVVCGALCIFGKIIVPDLVVQVIGVLLIIFAVSDMTGGIMIKQSYKSSAKTVDAKIVDEK